MASTSTSGSNKEHEVMGAFDGIAPSESASASKRLQKPAYDVFINHRGPDVKHTLARVLYSFLTSMALSVFLDSEELEYGDFLPRTIEAAMKGALLHIAIFSERYAESPWCLEELSFMLATGATIIPIFYRVDPADLRWVGQGKGKYAKAFQQHEQKGRYSLEKLEKWKKALHNASFYTGEIIQNNEEEIIKYNNEDEMRLLKNIERRVLKVINDVPLVVAKHPVGLKEIVQDFEMETLPSAQGDQVVQIVGICGMGGSGKTTLAKELYNKLSSSMERSSFVSDVRDAATKGLLHEKQKTLLGDLGVQNASFDNIEKGMGILSKHLRSVRVLIVIDDVDKKEQLDALLPTKDSLERGSLIIVTTRAYDVLTSWGISSIYKMKALDRLYAEQLFCWHAFLQSFPQGGFEGLVEKFLTACQGLPLSLKVFGGQLYGESRKEYWESLLHKISRILPNDIIQRLKLSYDVLDDEEKHMFLDTACFFIGEKSSLAIEIWNGLGWSGLYSWEKLLNKCLVEVDNNNSIRMHDHLRDLGRDIANQHPPYRIWSPQQIINVEKYQEGRIGIRGIRATPDHKYFEIKGKEDDYPVRCSRGKLTVETNCGIWSLAPSSVGLKYLVIKGDYFNQVMGEVSRELVWFRGHRIGLRNLSSGLSLKKLSVLQLSEKTLFGEHHLEELWGETDGEAPLQLRELLISDCHKLHGFPNSIRHLIHLRKIEITGGCKVRSLPDEFCLLQSLEHLVLQRCEMLSSLPSNFGYLRNLRHLSLRGCCELSRLPVSFKSLMLLEHLDLCYCSQLTFTSEDLNFLENISKLEYLSLYQCKQLEELPRHITNQVSLRTLDFTYTSLRELPDDIGQLSRLREMDITGVLLTSLPTSLGDLSSLRNLQIRDCPNLKCLPGSLGDLSSLRNLEIRDCPNLECLPKSLGALFSLTNLEIRDCPKLVCLPYSLGKMSSLMNLSIENCPKLECLPDSIEDLVSLTNLSIYGCSTLECLPDSVGHLYLLKELEIHNSGVKSLPKSVRQLNNLQRLIISGCPITELDFGAASLSFGLNNLKEIHLYESEVCRVSFSEGCCSHLEILKVGKNHHLEEIEALPRTLESIDLTDCEMLKNIRDDIGQLSRLKEISIGGMSWTSLTNSIGHLNHLKKIVIVGGYNVTGLTDEFCQLQLLEHLELNECTMLSSLPSRFGDLRNLRHLCLSGCSELTMLPASFKNLRLLEYLDLRLCYELSLPSDILENMTKLEMLSLVGCEKLEELPRHITNQASLKVLYLRGTNLRELPINIGQLSRLREMSIGGVLTRLPASLGDLSSLTDLSIYGCSKLECLPDSVGRLNLLEELEIHNSGVKSLPESVRQLNNLQRLIIFGCPINQLNFGAASLPYGPSNLKWIHLRRTEMCRISISEDCCPCLETFTLENNRHLEAIEALPVTLKSVKLTECRLLKNIPNFAQTTSLREFEVRGCHRIEKIEGLENCRRLESLRVDTCWELPGIESLEHMEKLRKLQLKANKGSAIGRCIPKIQKWPNEIQICSRAVPDAPWLVDSLVSSNLVVVNFSNQKIESTPKLVQKRSSNGDAIMLCFIVNCVSPQMTLTIHGLEPGGLEVSEYLTKLEKGRWAWVGVFTQRYEGSLFISEELSISGYGGECEEEDEVERGLLVRGEEQRVVETFHSLFPLLNGTEEIAKKRTK